MASQHISNSKLFDEGMKKARKIIERHMLSELTRVTQSLPGEAARYYYEEGGPMMTGNTITGYTARLWHRNVNMATASSGDTRKTPIRVKLREGEVFPAGAIRYDGNTQETNFEANVDTDADYSQNTAYHFLDYNVPSGATYIVRLTTGTEYSVWLEKMRRIDVLTNFSYRIESDLRDRKFWNRLP